MLEEKNLTYTFLLPCLHDKIPSKDLQKFTNSIEQCYLDIDADNNKYDLILTIKSDINEKDDDLFSDSLFLRCENDVRVSIPDKYIPDVINFTKGLYSKLSGELKLNIVKFHNLDDESLLWSILFRTQKIKDYWVNQGCDITKWKEGCEYWIRPNLKKEMFFHYLKK